MREYYRSFLAIPVHPAVGKRISRWFSPHAAELRLRAVPAENRHLTLAFLGETPVEQIAPIAEGLTRALEGFKPGLLEVAGAGVFPVRGEPRVLWAGCSGKGGWLEDLVERVRGVLDGFGFPAERGAYIPHITLSRIRGGKGEAVRALADESASVNFGSWTPDAVLFHASVSDRVGISYPVLATIPLNS